MLGLGFEQLSSRERKRERASERVRTEKEGEMRTSPRGLILEGKHTGRRCHGNDTLVLLARGRRKEERGFLENPLDLFVITKTFKTENSCMFLELLDKSKNHGKVHVDS